MESHSLTVNDDAFGTPQKNVGKKAGDLPKDGRIYRYWVELRDLRDGSGRDLPLAVITCIHIPRKNGEPQRPNKQVLRLQDDSTVIEARNIDDLATQLRERYPDETYHRYLRRERDYAAEQRWEEALQALAEIMVRAAIDDLMRKEARNRPQKE